MEATSLSSKLLILQEGDSEESTLWISDKCTEEVANGLVDGALIDLRIATAFGCLGLSATVSHHNEARVPDIMREPVANIIQKSLLRYVTVSAISAGEKDVDDSLHALLLTLMKCLGLEFEEEKLQGLSRNDSSPFESKASIDMLFWSILWQLDEQIIWEANRSRRFSSFLKGIRKREDKPGFWAKLMPFLFSMKSERLQFDYLTCLLFICKKVQGVTRFGDKERELIFLEAELQYLEEEEQRELDKDYQSRSPIKNVFSPGLRASAKEAIKNKRTNKKVLLVEQILIHLIGGIDEFLAGNSFRRKLDPVLSSVSIETIFVFSAVHDIRLAYSKQCFVGFVGPQNAGKSTLLNKLFGKTAETGNRTHTVEPTRYKVAENVFAVDFPGLDSLEDHRSRFAEFGQMNNLFIYVVPYNGSPSEDLVANVRTAYAMEKQAGNAARTLFCISMCGLERFRDDLFDGEYKRVFVQKIRKEIQKTDFETHKTSTLQKLVSGATEPGSRTKVKEWVEEIEEKQRELKAYTLEHLKEEDFIFTDQLSQDPSRGIEGPAEVKESIKEYLIEMQIYKKEQLDELF